jgi:hypothetical protein
MKVDLRINFAQKKWVFFQKHTFVCLMWFLKQTTITLIFSITPTNAHLISKKGKGNPVTGPGRPIG